MKLTLVQKVLISVIALFIATSAILSFVVASQIDKVYLGEQKRNVAEFVQKQANQHLKIGDFQTNKRDLALSAFIAYQNEIITPEIVRIKIYNSKGVVLYSDQTELIGQNLFVSQSDELKSILAGNIVADISKPTKAENVFEKQYSQLLEIYTPITFDKSNIVGIVETYYNLDLLNSEIRQSQIFFIISIAIIFIVLFTLLFFIINGASRRLIKQDEQLKRDIQKEKEFSSLKDEFIQMSSHQLRTPASVVKWSLELMQDEKIGKLNKEQKGIIKDSSINIEILIAIINNLLVVSDVKPDYFTFEKTPYVLKDIIMEVLQMEDKKIKEKKLQVSLIAGEKLSMINLRKDALTTIVRNLISNALDYTPSGGKISVQVDQIDNNHQQFSIEDTGIGIPENEKEKLFDKFFRAKNAIEQKNVGSGLGLYISKKILEGYGGAIWFESHKEGAKFIFTIPVSSKLK